VVDTESHIRNDVPPRTVANSDKENSQRKQTANPESTNPALTPTTTAELTTLLWAGSCQVLSAN